MAPLGVRVITLLTGGVATRFLSNLDPVDLPKDSYYLNVKDVIMHRSEDVPMAVSAEAFAQEVLRPVQKGASGKAWVGGAAWMARVLMLFMPECVFVSTCPHHHGAMSTDITRTGLPYGRSLSPRGWLRSAGRVNDRDPTIVALWKQRHSGT